MLKNKPIIGIIPTYNLSNEANDPYLDRASFVRMYEEKIVASGGIPVGLLHQNIENYLELCDGYLWPGGGKVWPDFYPVIEDAIKNKKPLLGICLGMQAIGAYFNFREEKDNKPNASLEEIKEILKEKEHYLKKLDDSSFHSHYVTKDKETIDKARHKILLAKKSLLYKVLNQDMMNVVSLHSVVLPYVAKDLTVSATSEDGVIEGIEYTKNDAQIIGVQYHPELEESSLIFDWLIDASYRKFLFLVNKQKEIPSIYQPNIILYKSEYPPCINDGNISAEVLSSWLALRNYMRSEGYYIEIESAYRSHEIQRKIYEENKTKYGEEHTNIFVVYPGHSEHETGLALDVCMKKDGIWLNEFDERLAGFYVFLHRVCGKFGFILRYPEGKENVTGYHYEPWHLRYIGSPRIAQYIMDNHITLEEYENIKILNKKMT